MNRNFLIENIVYIIGEKTNYGAEIQGIFTIGIETFLRNCCFSILFITTIYYWMKFIFFSKQQYNNFGLYGLASANFILLIQLCLRWLESGHFPLSNLYDSLLFLAWGILLLFIILEKSTKFDLLGIIVSPTILCITAFTEFSLPEDLQKIKPLVPALQSNWLFMHVTVMIFSYAALIFGSLLSISFILYFYYLNNVSYNISNLTFDNKNIVYETRLNLLDNLSYRLIGIGFCLLTLGILSGAIWANETWGNYWSWAPKETWALITWLVFAIYLHTRLIHGVQGLKSAWIAFCGFLILWICYLGVNLLGEGLHTYGFLDS
jgi:cytochrome c-type biogenesis protein CcsB